MRYAPERQQYQQPALRVHQNGPERQPIYQQPVPRVHQNRPEKKPSSHQPFEQSPPRRDEKKCETCENREKNILEKLLPENIYNPKTKKLFGILSADELLLISLIFLFADSDKEDSNLLCLALLYLLFADKFDLSSFFK